LSENSTLGKGQTELPEKSQGCGQFTNMPAQRGDDGRCIFAGHLDQDGKTRMSFHQGCEVTVAGTGEQIALPMIRNGTVFNLCLQHQSFVVAEPALSV
jgi:hypothetical protein